jgi:hypothetical protein
LPIKNIIKLLIKAQEKEQEELLWQRWLAIYPYMETGKLKFMSFNDYKDKLISKKFKTTNMTKEEIEEDILKIKALYERR